MRLTRRATLLSVAALLASPALVHAAAPTGATPSTPTAVEQTGPLFQPWLEQHLTEIAVDAPLRVAVRGTSTDAAVAAVESVGLAIQERWALVDTVVAVGPAAAVASLRDDRRVERVDGDTPLALSLETAHEATRSDEALAAYADAAGARVDGTGVTIAVIDSGIDGTHPMFQADGVSTVVRNLKNVCGAVLIEGTGEACFQQVPVNDSDTISAGGHGTHVAGIAAGREVTTTAPAGIELRGSAPGAKLVGLSVGAGPGLLDAMSAQNWVLEHQQNPCRSAAEQTADEVDAACPPIRVTNHSYGPAADGENGNSFDENSTAVTIQRALVSEGVIAVWAAGNSGGDGSLAFTNPTAMDPTPGVVMVASYNDGGTGSRDNALSTFSSRGKQGEPGTYPDLSAPGDLITSACRAYLPVCATGSDVTDGGNYNTISGTSMASPYVAGVVAQMLQADSALTPAQVEEALEDNAHKFASGGGYEADPANPDDTTSFDKGHGLVDVAATLAQVLGTTAPESGSGGSCAVDAAFTDTEGDANRVLADTPLPSDPSLDVVGSALSTDVTTGAVTFTIDVSDLTAPTAYGQYFDYNATIGGKGYFLSAQRTLTGEETFELGDFSGAQGTRATLATLTGAFDDEADQVRITVGADQVTPALADGQVIAGLGIVSRRQFDAVAVSFIPDADDAAGACPYVVGAEHAAVEEPVEEEPPAEPECTRPNGKPCKDKGNGDNPSNG